MPLSLSKLQDFLANNGFIPNKLFVLDGFVFYIELYSIKSAELFLLYIPSKYNFRIERNISAYKIRSIDMGVEDNLTDEYAGAPKDFDVEEAYGGGDIQLSPDKDHIEKHLENNYRHPISLKDLSKEDTISLKTVFRQLRRLKYCVQNIKYKLGIQYKNYLCTIRRDDSINCFVIKHYPRTESKRLLVIVDLETFYDKSEKLVESIQIVQDSVYRILERNQGTSSSILDRILENKKDIAILPKQAQTKKNQYDTMLEQTRELLSTMIEAEKKVLDELYEADKTEESGLQSDISRAHNKSRLEKELDKINVIKGHITKTLVAIREKRENTILGIDDLLFNNTVMFDSIVKNFVKLKNFC